MGTEELNNELTDIALCYQSMGVPLDASPAEIEQMYRTLTEENKRKLASPDPGTREDARQSLELVSEMYDKIRCSITYHAMEKDHLKKSSDASPNEARVKRPVHRAVAEKSLMVHCPRCNGSITKGLKTCPICKTHLYTVTEQILRTYFTPVKSIVYCIILAVASLAIYGVLHSNTDRPKDGMTDIDSLEQKNTPK